MSRILIRQLGKEDWQVYREIRLHSLKQDPDSFCSTYESESKLTDEHWMERLCLDTRTFASLPLIAQRQDEYLGLACGVVHGAKDDAAQLYQMWVAPDSRGSGIGRRLVEEIVSWAKDLGVSTLNLGVTSSNTAAVRLYESVGFIPVGELQALRTGSELRVQNMTLCLDRNDLHN